MKKDKSIKGRWWIDGPDKPPLPGVLDASAGGFRLSVWVPQDCTPEDVFLSISTQPQEVSNIIIGADGGNNPVTLFGCGVIGHGSSAGLRSLTIHVSAVLKGQKVKSWREPFVRSVKIKPAYLHRWFERKLLVSVKTVDDKTALTFEEHLDLLFPVEDGVKIRFSDGFSSSVTLDEEKFTADSQIWFHFEELQSLATIENRWVPWVRRLFGLFYGVPAKIEEVEVFTNDPFVPAGGIGIHESRGILMRHGMEMSEEDNDHAPDMVNMVVPYGLVQDKLGNIVVEWNRMCKTQEPVVSLFGAVVLHESLYLEARFLFLVQALEIYHVFSGNFSSVETPRSEHKRLIKEAQDKLPDEVWEWAKGKLSYNARPLSKKLLDIFTAHKEACERLFGDLERAASQITKTRNQLTHHSDHEKPNLLIPEDELGGVSWKLEALLWAILLREIGIDGSPIERIVRRAADIRLISLDASSESPAP